MTYQDKKYEELEKRIADLEINVSKIISQHVVIVDMFEKMAKIVSSLTIRQG